MSRARWPGRQLAQGQFARRFGLICPQDGGLGRSFQALFWQQGAALASFVDDDAGDGRIVEKTDAVLEFRIYPETDGYAAVNGRGKRQRPGKTKTDKTILGVEEL